LIAGLISHVLHTPIDSVLQMKPDEALAWHSVAVEILEKTRPAG